MRNVTITLDEQVVTKARVEAAREGKSLSRFVSDLVADRVDRDRRQTEALEAFLAGGPWPSEGESLTTREEIYEERFRGHQRSRLPAGSGLSGEGRADEDLDVGPRGTK